ncbi:hypothetical protein HK104_007030 [Borealophlyctis nickersoniae]|nr:hypothetical protein HK104_007030 [Borealophlyctis nickersoniae]
MNYACVMVGFTSFLSIGWWLLGARKWFRGPKIAAELHSELPADLERDATAVDVVDDEKAKV